MFINLIVGRGQGKPNNFYEVPRVAYYDIFQI